jgi:hypothetical protein
VSRDKLVIADCHALGVICVRLTGVVETRMVVHVRKEAEVSRTSAAAGQPLQPFLVQALRAQRLSVPCSVVANGCRRLLDA